MYLFQWADVISDNLQKLAEEHGIPNKFYWRELGVTALIGGRCANEFWMNIQRRSGYELGPYTGNGLEIVGKRAN